LFERPICTRTIPGTNEFLPVVRLGAPDIFDVSRAALESFARAASGGTAFPITTAELIHSAAVTEAIVKSAETELPEKVNQ